MFSNKDPNPTTGAVNIIWQTSAQANVALDMVCNSSAISFSTDKGNNPNCAKGGVWIWNNQNSGNIFVTLSGNAKPVTIPFTLTVLDQNGGYTNQKQTIYVSFPVPASPIINSFSVNVNQQFSLDAKNYSTIAFQVQCGSFMHVLRSVDGSSLTYPTGSASLCSADQYFSKSTTNADPSVPPIYNQSFVLWNANGAIDGQTSFVGNGPTSNNNGSAGMTVKVCNIVGKCVQQTTTFPIYAKG